MFIKYSTSSVYIIKECKLGRLGCIGFVFRILQQQPEYEERRSSCAEQESSLSSLAATRQHVFLPPSALLSRHFFSFQWHQHKWLTPWLLISDYKWQVKHFQEGDKNTIMTGTPYTDMSVIVTRPWVVFLEPHPHPTPPRGITFSRGLDCLHCGYISVPHSHVAWVCTTMTARHVVEVHHLHVVPTGFAAL